MLPPPDLAPRLTALADYLRWHSSLPPRLSELAILITAREWTAQYEWYAHYPNAIEGGLDPKVAAAIAEFYELVRTGAVRVDIELVPLAQVADVWHREHGCRRLVLIP